MKQNFYQMKELSFKRRNQKPPKIRNALIYLTPKSLWISESLEETQRYCNHAWWWQETPQKWGCCWQARICAPTPSNEILNNSPAIKLIRCPLTTTPPSTSVKRFVTGDGRGDSDRHARNYPCRARGKSNLQLITWWTRNGFPRRGGWGVGGEGWGCRFRDIVYLCREVRK